MWKFLGLVVFCSLVSPLQGGVKGTSPGIVFVLSPATTSQYISALLLRYGLLQSHLLAIEFPDTPHKGPHPEHWIKELHIVKVFVPVINVELQEDGLALMCVKARLHLSGKFFFGKHFEQIDVIIDVDIKAEVKIVDFFAGIVHIKLQVCKTEFKVARIICPSHLLVRKVEPVVTTILAASLHKSLCTVVELVIDVARVDFLHTTNVLVSVGTVATIQYQLASLPVITSSYFAVELNMIIRAGGRFITVPVSSVPVGVPSLLDNALSLGITQASLNTILSVVIQIHVQEFICTPQVFSAADELTDAIAVLLSHQKCPKCPGKSPLKISITLVGAKRVILEPKRAILELSVEIGVSVKGPSGALIRLFVLKANLKLSTQASVHDRKLFFTTKLVSLELTLVSSEVGPIEISGLVKLTQLLVVETFLPLVNECLDVGIPLPSPLYINVASPVIQMMQPARGCFRYVTLLTKFPCDRFGVFCCNQQQ